MTRIIGFTGFARSGKDTSGQHLISTYGFSRFAFGDQLKNQLYALDPRISGTVSARMLLDSLDGDWDRALGHRVHGPELRQLIDSYRTKVAHGLHGRFDLVEEDLREDIFALDPFLDGEMSLGMLLDSLGGDWEKAKAHRIHKAEIRRIQQAYGTEVCRGTYGQDVWVRLLEGAVRNENPAGAVVTDVRFDEEAEWVVSQGGEVIEIVRPGVSAANGHVSEKGIDRKFVSATLVNDGTPAVLASKLDAVLKLAPVALAAA